VSAVGGGQPPPSGDPEAGLPPRWRERQLELQQQALGGGRVTVTCPAPFGGGGLGRHLQEIVQALGRGEAEVACLCESATVPGASVPAPAGAPRARLLGRVAAAARKWPAWRTLADSASFDIDAAARLPPAAQLIAFNGTALAQFRATAAAGTGAPALMAANSHIDQMLARHELALRQYPVEPSWATRLGPRNRAEYALAERIFYASDYVRDSFLERGFAPERLVRFPLTPGERFAPAPRMQSSGTFHIVYCGTLAAHKGVPLLLDAFSRVPGPELRLTLLGGWRTRHMRRHIERARAADARITAGPGDPLELLCRADLYVHPAYEDGFAYAAAEALACGVPMIVSEDTGMKELIATPRQGVVVPTGDLDALTQTIAAAVRGEILKRG
jgi:glycosyltransferase involved in cell wall biosynthesis